jgi:hypothetical protein
MISFALKSGHASQSSFEQKQTTLHIFHPYVAGTVLCKRADKAA